MYTLHRTLLPAFAVLLIGALVLIVTPRRAQSEARLQCNNSYCSWECSIINCVADAECAATGSCTWDEVCQGPKVTCHDPE